MNSEEVKKIKCDRCGAVIGLYRHDTGWRCPQCIWNERENLIEWAKNLLNTNDYKSETKRRTVVVMRKNMDSLAEVVKEVTAVPSKNVPM